MDLENTQDKGVASKMDLRSSWMFSHRESLHRTLVPAVTYVGNELS